MVIIAQLVHSTYALLFKLLPYVWIHLLVDIPEVTETGLSSR